MQTIVQQLKGFAPEQHSVDDMVCLLAQARQLRQTYSDVTGGEVPEWLTEAEQSLGKAIDTQYRDELMRQLKEVEGRREALKSAEEKRHDLADKEARLRQRLGLSKPQAVA